jgi:hypothetical protein
MNQKRSAYSQPLLNPTSPKKYFPQHNNYKSIGKFEPDSILFLYRH